MRLAVNIARTQSTPLAAHLDQALSVSRWSIQLAMKWQPMPACAREPSGTFVERLCGQPAQNHGARHGTSGAPAGRRGTVKSTTRARRSSIAHHAPPARPRPARSAGTGAARPARSAARRACGVACRSAPAGRRRARRRTARAAASSTIGAFSSTTRISRRPCAKARSRWARPASSGPPLPRAARRRGELAPATARAGAAPPSGPHAPCRR